MIISFYSFILNCGCQFVDVGLYNCNALSLGCGSSKISFSLRTYVWELICWLFKSEVSFLFMGTFGIFCHTWMLLHCNSTTVVFRSFTMTVIAMENKYVYVVCSFCALFPNSLISACSTAWGVLSVCNALVPVRCMCLKSWKD